MLFQFKAKLSEQTHQETGGFYPYQYYFYSWIE